MSCKEKGLIIWWLELLFITLYTIFDVLNEIPSDYIKGRTTDAGNSAMELKLIPYMTLQSFWLKALGTVIVLVSVLLHIGGTMDLLTTLIMIISSYLIYAQLDNAGKYSALLRTVDVSVRQAQEILATPPT